MQEERDEDENLQPCGFQVQCRVLFSVYLCVSVSALKKKRGREDTISILRSMKRRD